MKNVTHLCILVMLVLVCSTADGALEFKIDVNSGSSPTESGWTALNTAAGSGNGSSVTVSGVEFAVLSADGHRDRGGPNALARDFIFDDGGLVGLTFEDLPGGIYDASVWAWDDDFSNLADQTVQLRLPNNSFITYTTGMDPSPLVPFTFRFDTSTFPAGGTLPGVFTSATTGPQGRFNALQLTYIPEPTTLLIWSLLAGLGVGLGWRRRRTK